VNARCRTAARARTEGEAMRYRLSRLSLLCGIVFSALIAGPAPLLAQQVLESRISTEYQQLRLVRLAPASHPWAMAFVGGGRLLVTERAGRMHLVDMEAGGRTEVTGVPDVHAQNQGGLLDAVPHPDHANNGWIYFTYSKGSSDSTTTALGRARLDGTRLIDFEELFVSNAWGRPGGHYGSRIVFLGDGTLLMTVGDRMREPTRAQDPLDHAGSILRLNEDGTVPGDNPFAGNAAYAPEVYSYGHRNIQGMVMHPITRDVWIFEHGPRGSDLLHRVAAGGNYGWPVATRGREYRTQEPFGDAGEIPVGAAVVAPVHEFVITLAPSGLAVITGQGWHETWQGNIMAGALRGQRLVRLVPEAGELVHAEEMLIHRIGRIRDVRQGPDGFVYIATDEEEGGIYRLEPAG
jgi:aldose sugar dehydrogenase